MTAVTADAVPARDLSAARAARIARLQARMVECEVDAALLSLGADLPWCTGYEAMPLERPTVLVLPDEGEATLVVPYLEAPRVETADGLFALRPWKEGEDAPAIVAGLVGRRRRVAISDRTWSALLLELQGALPGASFVASSTLSGPLRARKDEREIAALRAAGAAADRVAEALVNGEIPLVGREEQEVSAELSARLLEEGHAVVNFAIVGSGPNAASPHHEAGTRRIGRGETVVCDFGGSLRLDGDIGYCSDITRTLVTGEPSSEIAECYEVLAEAQAAAVAAVVPGRRCEEVDRVGRARIAAAGLAEYFIHRIGHGIGIDAHEDPYIIEGNSEPLLVGHAFSVEPGIYLPGRFGARLEDIVVVTEDGVESLNSVDHSLRVVEA